MGPVLPICPDDLGRWPARGGGHDEAPCMLGRCNSASCSGSIGMSRCAKTACGCCAVVTPGSRIYGLYGGPRQDESRFAGALRPHLDDFWAFRLERDRQWRWRNGDLMLSAWFTGRGESLEWDSIFVAQWDMVVVTSLARLLPPLAVGEMLVSGIRPVREVEPWWQWTQGTGAPGVRSVLGPRRLALRCCRGPHVLSIHRARRPP